MTVDEVASIGDLRTDLVGRVVEPRGQAIEWTPTQSDLLVCAVPRPNRVITPMQLVEGVQGHSTPALVRNIDTQAMNLRRKIEGDPTNSRLLLTV